MKAHQSQFENVSSVPNVTSVEFSDPIVTGDQHIGRRTFCNRLVVSSSAMLLAASALHSQADAHQIDQVAYPPLKIEGAEALMPGSSLYFTYPQHADPAILVRSWDGEYYAYGQKCSHLGCSVYFDRARGCLECPCHKGAYEANTGNVLHGPPTRPLDQIVLQMRAGGQLWAVGRGIGRDNSNG